MAYSLVLFLSLSLLLLCCMGCFGWVVSFCFVGFPWSDLVFFVMVDNISCLFLLMLFGCGGIAGFYCFHYFLGGPLGLPMVTMVAWFVMVMSLLVFSYSIIFTLVMWEYLGIVSFFLILFYSNMASLRAAVVTLFASRFGDVGLFFILGWCSNFSGFSFFLPVFFMLLIVGTKSACFPFISWLIEAMRAPTPVSSLVHSSTLVAAGVWFLFRYPECHSHSLYVVLFFLSCLTVLVSGACACVFLDLKKVVALSTCNNVSWCLIFYVCGDLELSLIQLLTHGVCKCYLFMTVGDLMNSSGGSQSFIGIYSPLYLGTHSLVVRGVLIFSLCGLPFIGVFFSKHGFFCLCAYLFNFFLVALLFIGVFLTNVYSFRLFSLLCGTSAGIRQSYYSPFLFVSFLIFWGSFINFFGLSSYAEVWVSGIFLSKLLMIAQFVGWFVGFFLVLITNTRRFRSLPMTWTFFPVGWLAWLAVLCGGDYVVAVMYRLWLQTCLFCGITLYRWEVCLVRWLLSFPFGMYRFSVHLLSINFLVCGFVLAAALFFVFD